MMQCNGRASLSARQSLLHFGTCAIGNPTEFSLRPVLDRMFNPDDIRLETQGLCLRCRGPLKLSGGNHESGNPELIQPVYVMHTA